MKESLSEVCKILRYRNQHNLASLLTSCSLDLELLDVGFPMQGDSEVAFVNAIVYAPISVATELRALGEDGHNAILQALGEVWPLGETGGTYIRNVDYRIDLDSLNDDPLVLFDSSSDWERVDRTMDKLRERLNAASIEEDFQQVGHLCREALISMAQAVFDPQRHPASRNDAPTVSKTDVKRMMERYLAVECSGPGNEEIRKCMRSAFDLANAVQHARNSSYREAALCMQATFNVVGLIQIISGQRDRATE